MSLSCIQGSQLVVHTPSPSTPPVQGVFTSLAEPIQRALSTLGHTTPHPIQTLVIPHLIN
ncbi:hypothetical protein KIPB_016569, partial [Kipferlia bialata]|eukprot:g16569.t1